MVRLISADNEVFEVSPEVAGQSEMLRNLLEDTDAIESVPLSAVSSGPLAKVLEWCAYHATDSDGTRPGVEVEEWDRQFADVDQQTLFDVMLAANYLNVEPLVELTCRTVADMMKGREKQT